ncbi:glycosyl transferase [Caldalkalibacillus thermarum]|uniref:N-acetyl-alpha-D-glucosaminyl L-malate synthase BshA n=1 Tax=Caldalkalibacillus thermarum TaxID=296745 RepID=UPI001669B338|nr:N-acetyl-alpha-D-glucosaminyl L-malate synthase BshA [Caldalkalibacillus thermarum]GGK24644.1 glycosyl transferase [Caldalkalibacillus thermarum]
MEANRPPFLKIGISCYPTLGGSGVVATELGKLLAERGHEIHFITAGVPFRLGKYYHNIYYHEVEVNQYDVFRYPPYDLTLASKMAQVASREKLDLLHVHYAVPHAVCAILARQMVKHPLKVVTTLHGTDITVLAYDETLKEMIRYGIEQSDLVTAVSDHLIAETYEVLNVSKDIYKVYNFVDHRQYERPANTLFKQQYAPQGEKLLVHISNFRPVKRVLDVAKIFQIVRTKIPAKLIFIGEGPDFTKVYHWLREHQLDPYVHFLGKLDDVAEILFQIDLMLLPSEKESFGLVALEAMACGVPVIASNAGGIPEVVEHGRTGLIYPIGDIEGMAEGAVTLLSRPDVYSRFSQAAVERARTLFAADNILEQYLSLYRMVLNR